MIRTFLVSTLSVGLSLGAVAGIEDRKDVREWLEAMTTAVRSLNYEGTFVYLHDNQLESMRVIHTNGNTRFLTTGRQERWCGTMPRSPALPRTQTRCRSAVAPLAVDSGLSSQWTPNPSPIMNFAS